MTFTIYSAEGEARTEYFHEACASEHAVAYVQADAISEDEAQALLSFFEAEVRSKLPAPTSFADNKLSVLFSCMGGQMYGYTPLPIADQGPIVCLNALYPEHLGYALAHEYQHLCAYDACVTGGTMLSEETDELLSDIFCELLFPDQGSEGEILFEERAIAAQSKIADWGSDALLNVYSLLREGYSEEGMLSAMENR